MITPLITAFEQLQAYFQGELAFSASAGLERMGEFQRRVLQLTMAIPMAACGLMARLLRELANSKAARAVGVRRQPIPFR